MNQTQTIEVTGAAGVIEVAVDRPDAAQWPTPRGLALVLHPHPLQGGANQNKVVQTVARACVSLGLVAARPNFRGVGSSAGSFDEGRGELDDMQAVFTAMREQVPEGELVLAGFSFGSYVQSHLARRIAAAGTPITRVILMGTAASRWDVAPVPPDTLVIHGEVDDVVPLAAVLDWARPQDLPVVVIPGGDHFFNRKLVALKRLVLDALAPRAAAGGQAAPGADIAS
jgi:alpha/beta superfamily hydrolase